MSVAPSVVTPGSLVTVRITGFSLGTVGQGPNGTYDAWLQPIGNLDFDPTCLRLVRSEVQLNSISGSAFVDRLYFTDLRSSSNNPADYVAYTFLSLRPCTTVVQPYQEAASGAQEKYNADFSASTSRSTVTGDGVSALIITVQPDRSTVSAGDTIHCTVTFSAPNAPATVVDLNNDGELEVLVGAADGKLYAWHQDGQPLAGWPITLNPSFRILATPAVGNIDGDGFLDVAVPLADGKLYAVDARGVLKAGWPVSICGVPDLYNGQVINSSPRIVDLDGNGAPALANLDGEPALEVVAGDPNGTLYVWNAGNAAPQRTLFVPFVS